MSKKKREDKNRRPRAEHSYRESILAELERAGAPLTRRELVSRLAVRGRALNSFEQALSDLEQAGRVVKNRAGSLLVADRIAVVAGRVEGHRDGHGFLKPDDGSA